MNRQIVGFAALVGLLLAVAGDAEAQQGTRFAYINSQRILAEAPGTSDAQTQLESTMEQYRVELQTFEQELETLQENFDRQQATLTAAIRQERQQEMQQKFAQYQQRRQELEQQAQQRQAELVQPIMARIQTVIEQIRAEGNYSIIFDATAGSIITADPALDLTQQVLDRLASGSP